jgi:cobalt-precorrin 5A hydrolase/precorrin-3B C17-methyltransferase
MTAIVVLGPSGLPVAKRLQAQLPDVRLHGYSPRVADADVRFDDVGVHLRKLFGAGEAIIGVCAAGILIRALASVLADKQNEPPVVAIAEDGSVAVPLLGGHHGANELALRCAGVLDGKAAITTAGDVRLGLALDQPPVGWRAGNPAAAKAVAAALLAGERAELTIEAAEGDCDWLRPLASARKGKGSRCKANAAYPGQRSGDCRR